MSVLDFEQFDLISTHIDGYIVLTVSDHLPWDEDEQEHLLALQTKINNYLEAVETGQLESEYPAAAGKEILIQVIMKFTPSNRGYEFLRSANNTLNSAGYKMNIGFLRNGNIVTEEIE